MRLSGRAVVLTASLTLLALTGCGTPPWEKAEPTPSASVTVTPTPSASPSKIRNDLSKGSLKRSLSAGGVKLTINYYSTLAMNAWTPAATKPLTIAMVGDFPDGSTQNIYLSKLTITTDVGGAAGPMSALPAMVDQANVPPGYLIKAPTSYGQVFSFPAVPDDAQTLTLNLTYELLVQTAPKAKEYARQAASDTVVIGLASS